MRAKGFLNRSTIEFVVMKTNIAAAHHALYALCRSIVACATLLFLLTFTSVPMVAQVHFDKKADRIDVQINGKPLTALHYGKDVGKPSLHPLIGASGNAVTRGFPNDTLPGGPTDRPHLRRVIIGAEKVSAASDGVQYFWENDPDPHYGARINGNIVLQDVKTTDGADTGTLQMVANWHSKQGQFWIIERRTMTLYTKPADSRMFDIDLSLEAANEEVAFLDVKDAILIHPAEGPARAAGAGGSGGAKSNWAIAN
jgi:hypothetical protein